jgi:hypothetical protein
MIADDTDYYRIQVKSVQTRDPHVRVENKWQSAKLDNVIYFSTLADWGLITPAFPEASRPLDAPNQVRFHAQRTNFLKAFKKVWRLLRSGQLFTQGGSLPSTVCCFFDSVLDSRGARAPTGASPAQAKVMHVDLAINVYVDSKVGERLSCRR